MKKQFLFRLSFLAVFAVLLCFLYLTYQTHGNLNFALQIRGRKLIAFILVSIAVSFATVTFQTMTQNHFLTPNILGYDSLYVVIQTLLFFFIGGVTMLSQETLSMFFANILLMTLVSLLLSKFLLKRSQNNLFLLLMIGMILGTLFSSLSTFLQVLMDPNEYNLLQGRLFASFGNINGNHLIWATVIIVLGAALLMKLSPYLDVLHLGNDQATNLGIQVSRFQTLLFALISLLTGTATALVGPITFLGFIAANISYQLTKTYLHRWLFLTSTLIGIILLVGGQFLVEQVFALNATLSVVIEFVGGIYFVGKIVHERKKTA